jgi:RNA polymerase sigma-70 factor, ECF subfamily
MKGKGAVPGLDGLVAQAQQGDRRAFAQVYEHLFDRVYRYMLLRVGVPEEAEDLTQEVFVRVWEALTRYQPRGLPFGAWVFRIAHNLVVDRYRRQGERGAAPLDTASSLAGSHDPAEEASTRLDVQRLHALLGHLTELQRQVVLLRFVAGMSIQETARALNKKEGAVKALQHAALENLRRLLTGKPLPEGKG